MSARKEEDEDDHVLPDYHGSDQEYVIPSIEDLPEQQTGLIHDVKRDCAPDSGNFEDEDYVLSSLKEHKIGQNCSEYGLKYDKMGSSENSEVPAVPEDDEYILLSRKNLTGDNTGESCYVNVQPPFTNGNIGADNRGFEIDTNDEFRLSHMDLRDASNDNTSIASNNEKRIVEQGQAAKIAADISSMVHKYLVRHQIPLEHEKSRDNLESISTDENFGENLEQAIATLASHSVMSYFKQHGGGATEGGMLDAEEIGIDKAMVSEVLTNHYVNVSTGANSTDGPKSGTRGQNLQGANSNDGAASGSKLRENDKSFNSYVNVDISVTTADECLELIGIEDIQYLKSKQSLQGENSKERVATSSGATGNETEHDIKNNIAIAFKSHTKRRNMDPESMAMAGSTVEKPYDYATVVKAHDYDVIRDSDNTKASAEASTLPNEPRRLSDKIGELPNEPRGLLDKAGAPVNPIGRLLHRAEEPNIERPSDYREPKNEEVSNVLLTWALRKDHRPPLTKDENSYTLVDEQATLVDNKDLEPFMNNTKEDHCPEHPLEHIYQEIGEIGQPNISATHVQLQEISSNQNNNNNNNNNIDELPLLPPRVRCSTNTMKISILVAWTVLLVAGLIVFVIKINV